MKTERTGCIYRYHKDGMSYVGQSVNLRKRRNFHETTSGGDYFHNSILKYGADAFEFEILEDGIPESKLDDQEIFWIEEFDCVFPNGYNFTKGGSRPVFSEELKRKISESLKGKKRQPFSEKHRRRMPKSLRGKKRQPHTPETRKKISESHKGQKHSPESRKKISEAMKGKKRKPFTDEHRRKMSEASKKRKPSPEHRKKISESLKKRNAANSSKQILAPPPTFTGNQFPK